MKAFLVLSLCLVSISSAAFETWTNKNGKTAELDLVRVIDTKDGKAGEFRMRNGKQITLQAADLAGPDAKRLADWKPLAVAADSKPSAFDDVLDGNLVKLTGRSLKRFKPEGKPRKYYIFYYTASWCGPCQQFTPSLVEFYNANKDGNDNFELVLISSDDDEGAMENYAKDKKMPWPQLKLGKVAKFERDFNHGVTGIPSVVVCDLDGKVVAKTQSIAELEKLVK